MISEGKNKTGKKPENIKDRKDTYNDKQCPKCKSVNVISTGYENIPPYFNMKVMRCLNCNFSWVVLPV